MKVEQTDIKSAVSSGARAKARSKSQASDLAVGARLKAIREQMGLSQRELAKRAKVTNSTISLIEQESHAPSLASLHRILNAIPISMADFFALPASPQNVLTYAVEDMAIVTQGRVDMRVMGSERRDKRLQMFIERYSVGGDTGRGFISHEGETAALVIEGTVELETSEGVTRIEAGGGFHILGSESYRLRNVGTKVAIVACAVTPPML